MSGEHIDSSPLLAPASITASEEIDLEAGPEDPIQCRICHETDDFVKMRGKHIDSSLLIAPAPITASKEIDLEAGSEDHIQCRICRETDDFVRMRGEHIYSSPRMGFVKMRGEHSDSSPRMGFAKMRGEHMDSSPRMGFAKMRCEHMDSSPRMGFVRCEHMDSSPRMGFVRGEHIDSSPRMGFVKMRGEHIDSSPQMGFVKMPGEHIDSSPLMVPAPIPVSSENDLEAGPEDQIQCRICLETDGRDFIAPCKCKGTSKYVHRKCLDHWRTVKEGYAFFHCTTCKARYKLRVHTIDDRRWQTLKFRFFVTRDILFSFFAIQLVIALLSYLVYLIDGCLKFGLWLSWGFGSELSFYYICGAILFFAFMGLSGCVLICCDQSLWNDPVQPCRDFYLCCCQPGIQLPQTFGMWRPDYTTRPESCCNISCECDCLRGEGSEAGLPILFIMGLIVICLLAVIGIFYSFLVATMFGQRIWQRHYHILARKMLTKEYIVEDADGEMTGAEWPPRNVNPEQVQWLEALGLI